MITRRLAARGLVRKGSTEPQRPRRRAGRFLTLALTAGALAGAAAWLQVWPFGQMDTLVPEAARSQPQLSAQSLFPPVTPKPRTVDVYDPPPPVARRPQPAAGSAAGNDGVEHETDD